MSGFSIWHAVMLVAVIVVIAIPAAIIATTGPGRTIGVGEFRGWALGWIALALVAALFEVAGAEPLAGVAGLVAAIYGLFFVRKAAERAQDNGNSKWLALLTIVPLVNLLLMLYLCYDRVKRG